MTEYKPLPDDQIRVGALAFARATLRDTQEHDLGTFWTTVIVQSIRPDRVEVSPFGSSIAALGAVDSLILRRCEDGYIPLYKLTIT
jgi:hypothetical protein